MGKGEGGLERRGKESSSQNTGTEKGWGHDTSTGTAILKESCFSLHETKDKAWASIQDGNPAPLNSLKEKPAIDWGLLKWFSIQQLPSATRLQTSKVRYVSKQDELLGRGVIKTTTNLSGCAGTPSLRHDPRHQRERDICLFLIAWSAPGGLGHRYRQRSITSEQERSAQQEAIVVRETIREIRRRPVGHQLLAQGPNAAKTCSKTLDSQRDLWYLQGSSMEVELHEGLRWTWHGQNQGNA